LDIPNISLDDIQISIIMIYCNYCGLLMTLSVSFRLMFPKLITSLFMTMPDVSEIGWGATVVMPPLPKVGPSNK